MRDNRGFTMVELMVAMVIFVFAMMAATNSFMPLVNQFKQQGKITETEIEGIIGLDLLRVDIELAGTGLPWTIMDIDGSGSFKDDWDDIYFPEASSVEGKNYNDTGQAPRAILVGNEADINRSDYLVIKAVNVRPMEEAEKWSYYYNHPDFGLQDPYDWPDDSRDMAPGTKVIVIKPESNDGNNMLIVNKAAQYSVEFQSIKAAGSGFQPFDPAELFMIYGVGDSEDALRMPFNRADYYLSTSNVPTRCAPGTGVLIKGVILHDGGPSSADDGTIGVQMPLLDCVADMQIIIGIDNDDDGVVEVNEYSDTYLDPRVNGSLTAENIRNEVREIRIYILAHEGQKDDKFTYGSPTINVGEFGMGHSGAGPFDFVGLGFKDYEHYRWKVYTMVLRPDNLNLNMHR